MGALTHNGDVITGLPSTASQINYDNTSSGMAATQVQAAVDELNSNKQPKTDNNLQTTSKETTGAINELKSGLTNKHLITSTTHTIAGYYTEIGNVVIATGYFDPTDISSEQVKTNLPQPEGGFPIMWRDSTNGNLGEAFVAYENGTYIGTYSHTGTITVGNYIQFSFAYIKA